MELITGTVSVAELAGATERVAVVEKAVEMPFFSALSVQSQ